MTKCFLNVYPEAIHHNARALPFAALLQSMFAQTLCMYMDLQQIWRQIHAMAIHINWMRRYAVIQVGSQSCSLSPSNQGGDGLTRAISGLLCQPPVNLTCC